MICFRVLVSTRVREWSQSSLLSLTERIRNRTAPSTGGFARDAYAQTVRTSSLHQRTAERGRRAALLRRDEGCARSALEVRHPPPDHGARGARFHPPPAQPRPCHRGDQV